MSDLFPIAGSPPQSQLNFCVLSTRFVGRTFRRLGGDWRDGFGLPRFGRLFFITRDEKHKVQIKQNHNRRSDYDGTF